MGTRHLIAVQLDNEYRIAQYGQWDGCPSGQGADVLDFLKTWDRETFERKLRACSFMTEEDSKGVEALGENWKEKWGHLSRDMGAEILQFVHDAPEGVKLQNQISFAGDSLFCEWAYVIDLDKNTLEVFRGFNDSPLKDGERFKDTEAKGDYYPVKLAKSYSLDQLPTAQQLQEECDPSEEEEVA